MRLPDRRGPLSAHPLAAELRFARAALRNHPRVGAVIARTACFNVASTAAAALGGIIVARAVGPAVRGEYAAVTAWFGLLLMAGGVGQPAAVCFYVARYPRRARGYVATSRTMMLTTGAVALLAGLCGAPLLAHGNPGLTEAYRIAFASSVIAFVGASYTFALQARDTRRWNLVRVSQPLLALAAIILLWRLAAPHPAHRHRRDDRDHGDPARLRVLLVPQNRARSRFCHRPGWSRRSHGTG